MPIRLSRRHALTLTAASCAAPALLRAQTDPWDRVRARAAGLDQLRSILVMQDGEERLAVALRGPGLDTPVNVKSVSKTIVAAVLGAAIDREVVPSVTARLDAVAPDLIPAGAAEGVGAITLEDLVTMRAGLERTSGPNYGAWVASANWVADALGRPFVAEPGGRMLYSTGSFHVLGAALARASGRSLLQMVRDWIGTPLDLQVPPWTQDPQGFYLGGNQMALSPRGMVQFGELYRRDGEIGGTRVLSAEWVSRSFRQVTRSRWSGLGYSYGWFLGQVGGDDYALARGYGGQIICVCPARGMTVAITSDPDRPARSAGYFGDLQAMIENDILPRAA